MKRFTYLVLILLAVTSCEQEERIDASSIQEENSISTAAKGNKNKVAVCHNGKIINISINALNAHLNHGDAALIDNDGDGYVEAENACGIPGGDCNDDNANINPGAEEICGNGVDDDCDVNVDEGFTYVPNDRFEQNLIDQGHDDVLDDCVLTANIQDLVSLRLEANPDYGAETLPDVFDVIDDYTGIEDFAALEELTIIGTGYIAPYDMSITADNIDFSNNHNLRKLSLRCMSFDNVDLSCITNLEEMIITGLPDNVDECVSTVYNLDLSSNTNLQLLDLYGFTTDDLDLSISSAASIEKLRVGDIFETAGDETTLDLSNLSALKDFSHTLAIPLMRFERINLKNGANSILERFEFISLTSIGAYGGSSVCIEADDPTFVNSVITLDLVDPTDILNVTVSSDCGF